MRGILYGLGIGPGDPDLITLKALTILQRVPVIAYPAPEEGDSLARSIAARHFPAGSKELPLRLPLRPDADAAPHYDRHAETLADHLSAGRDVALLCVGDPLFYGSFLYVYQRLAGRYPIEAVPGVTSVSACAAAARLPLTSYDETLTVVPATLDEETLADRLAVCDAAAVMKVGRHLDKLRRVLDRLGLTAQAVYVERAGMADQRICPLADLDTPEAPYFSMVLIHRKGGAGR
ncbi:precorrin-2 C(20)-methyltransferase [Magnetospira sp. QH-2]|uniref:precorrin-2 C(20)-methyltransferase n=1 Tax=Magnetospira sp. (strain QH-2) TaxID=1288970 RepID=UPI0003E81AB1|nr:precorrin-2 C(20)-methyltransferase [Magnetospira sp. QH-2]CCQ72063.1 Precorrin-2 C(20)-methyltransferase [Magnetospira sp. QH-2]